MIVILLSVVVLLHLSHSYVNFISNCLSVCSIRTQSIVANAETLIVCVCILIVTSGMVVVLGGLEVLLVSLAEWLLQVWVLIMLSLSKRGLFVRFNMVGVSCEIIIIIFFYLRLIRLLLILIWINILIITILFDNFLLFKFIIKIIGLRFVQILVHFFIFFLQMASLIDIIPTVVTFNHRVL